MAWELVDCPLGTISNGDLIEIYKLLKDSKVERNQKLAERIESIVDLAKYDKTRQDILVDEGGIVFHKS